MGSYRRTELRGFRRIAMAFWDAPRDGTIYGHLQFEVTRAQRFIEDVKAKFGVAPSMGQLVGRAVACAATRVPDMNTKIIWGRPYTKDTVDVYFQVDVEDGKDLSGVTVPDTGRKSIVEVAETLRDRAGRLRGGKDQQYEKTQKGCLGSMPVWVLRALLGALTFLEYNLGVTPTFLGARPEPFGTLMVTNVSKFGIDVAYAPLIAVSRVPFICLVGQVKPAPWVVGDQVVVRPVITLSATFDHRVIDGNKIGKFIQVVRDYMANPYAFEPALGLVDPDPAPPKVDAAPAAPPAAHGGATRANGGANGGSTGANGGALPTFGG
ncbi:MAG: 2-oxo acid dehydrogenase subunit E2 [Planctomycetes bacterium]|nr:2-oxo acid dehydrogenase subunit E2 [Planctomycetota bacterium]